MRSTGERPPRILSARRMRRLLNLYPPFFFNRIRVLEIDDDFLRVRVRVARSVFTRNLQGTTFGGTIYAAADPIFAVMYWQVFAHRGERLMVWLRSAAVRYLAPAETALTLDFRLESRHIDDALRGLDDRGRWRRTHVVEAIDEVGTVCARIETEVYLRRPRSPQRDASAF